MAAEVRAIIAETANASTPFDDFWLLYPKRWAKKDARKAWDRIDPSLHNRIFIALVRWRQVWRNKEVEFLPHPATWLNGERWEDELPDGALPANASHISAVLPTGERGEIPAHVQAVLAKLRGRA